jgi:hypothetical protein
MLVVFFSVAATALFEPEGYCDPRGRDYRGLVSQTRSGRPCVPWLGRGITAADGSPYGLARFDSLRALAAGLGAHSACRNPDGQDGGPWCFTADPIAPAETCDVGRPLPAHVCESAERADTNIISRLLARHRQEEAAAAAEEMMAKQQANELARPRGTIFSKPFALLSSLSPTALLGWLAASRGAARVPSSAAAAVAPRVGVKQPRAHAESDGALRPLLGWMKEACGAERPGMAACSDDCCAAATDVATAQAEAAESPSPELSLSLAALKLAVGSAQLQLGCTHCAAFRPLFDAARAFSPAPAPAQAAHGAAHDQAQTHSPAARLHARAQARPHQAQQLLQHRRRGRAAAAAADPPARELVSEVCFAETAGGRAALACCVGALLLAYHLLCDSLRRRRERAAVVLVGSDLMGLSKA